MAKQTDCQLLLSRESRQHFKCNCQLKRFNMTKPKQVLKCTVKKTARSWKVYHITDRLIHTLSRTHRYTDSRTPCSSIYAFWLTSTPGKKLINLIRRWQKAPISWLTIPKTTTEAATTTTMTMTMSSVTKIQRHTHTVWWLCIKTSARLGQANNSNNNDNKQEQCK